MAKTAPIVIVFAIGGCGGSASSKSPTQPAVKASQSTPSTSTPQTIEQQAAAGHTAVPLSQTQLVAQANAVCKTLEAQRFRYGSSAQFELLLPALASHQRKLFTGLNGLTPPASMASDWGQMVAAAKTLADSIEQLNQVAHAGRINATTRQVVDHLYAAFAQARSRLDTIAKRNGINACATY